MTDPTGRRGRYPRFTRENSHLVRIGRSTWRSREYEIRRAPKYAVEAVVSRILDVADVDGNFVRTYLRSLSDVEFGDIPDEAAQLALLWLVSTGLVKKFRGSYQVVSDDDLLNGWEKLWSRLPLSRRRATCVG